jgi:hypothetical protein
MPILTLSSLPSPYPALSHKVHPPLRVNSSCVYFQYALHIAVARALLERTLHSWWDQWSRSSSSSSSSSFSSAINLYIIYMSCC